MATRLQPKEVPLGNLGAAGSGPEGKNRKSYTLDFKRQVINFYHAHAGNISLAAKMFGVDRKMVRSWVEQEDFFRRQIDLDVQLVPTTASSTSGGGTATAAPAFKPPVIMIAPMTPKMSPIASTAGHLINIAPATATPALRKRLERNFASGSSARYPELETALSDWWYSETRQGHDIKAKVLKSQALRLYQQLYPHSNDQDFKASTGWLQRFVSRMEAVGGTSGTLRMHGDLGGQPWNQRQLVNIRPAPQCPLPDYGKVAQSPSTSYEVQQQQQAGVAKRRKMSTDVVTDNEEPEMTTGSLPPQYVHMTLLERAALERQKRETDQFFHDCRDLLAFLEGLGS